ncbi:MAG: FecR domain-containing protein, partial [Acidobacteriota bacterium]|nr:FecR domain-containing protein [Acidobacteriota bacterium]
MSTHDPKDLDRILDQVLEGIRDDHPDPEVEKAAADRVWARLSEEARIAETTSSDACHDYRTMIPDYLAGKLGEARVVLLEDHVRECLPCRRALKTAREGESVQPAVVAGDAERTGSRRPWGWALAAAAGILIAALAIPLMLGPVPGTFEVAGLEGELYRITENGTFPVEAGDRIELAGGEAIRTAKGGSAILALADGSQVEMRERSEMGLTHDRALFGFPDRDATIDLARGSIIVEASDQGSGHMWVDTDDCSVSVQGTVFSVNAGTKGSRVSVLEGEVHVQYGDSRDVLLAGDQISTNPHLVRVPLYQEISWSRNSEQYFALLDEFKKLGKAIDEAVELPGLRYSDALLDQAPAGTVMYAALPNLGSTLGDAYDVIREKVNTQPLLNDWWRANVVETGAEPMIEMAVEKIRVYSEQLGPEIVLSLQADATGEPHAPLIFAQLNNPDDFQRFVEDEIEELADRPNIFFLDSPTAA